MSIETLRVLTLAGYGACVAGAYLVGYQLYADKIGRTRHTPKRFLTLLCVTVLFVFAAGALSTFAFTTTN